jgi:hypothetical protein
MNWKFWKNKKDIKTDWIPYPFKEPKTIPKWESSLKRESTIEINGQKWVVIDIGFEFIVVRNSKYNTWQIERRLLEDAT